MKFAAFLTIAVLIAGPASAQSMWGGSTATGRATAMNCNQMISLATSRPSSANTMREARAQHELSLAMSSMHAGNELACRLHAQNALNARR